MGVPLFKSAGNNAWSFVAPDRETERIARVRRALESNDTAALHDLGTDIAERRERHPSARLIKPIIDIDVFRDNTALKVVACTAIVIAIAVTILLIFAIGSASLPRLHGLLYWGGITLACFVIIVASHIVGVHITAFVSSEKRPPTLRDLRAAILFRRLRRGRCPSCMYSLHSLDAVTPDRTAGIPIGPERCPECGLAWPMVPPIIVSNADGAPR